MNEPIIALRVLQEAYQDENGELVYTAFTIQWLKEGVGSGWTDIEVQLNIVDAPEENQ